MVRIVCVADTHGFHTHTHIPPGDVLIHAGDCTRHGTLEDIDAFNAWLGTLPHPHKVVIAGNHDFAFQEAPTAARQRLTHAIYLEDAACTLAGLTFYGSPWTPTFFDWAFMLPEEQLAAKWQAIPAGVDILITHGPPRGILDRTHRGQSAGSATLFERVQIVQPRLHVFGHIHEAAGRAEIDGTIFLNASTALGHGCGVVVTLAHPAAERAELADAAR
ncbi:MAG: metallophosphatase domain-containing protein [Gemmataceae bacterium]|nr:metallophosphatase domain-containing protein [Gemmata sp.]MDW8199008.1 metallophosphatase domain-containing protein [Gemmataceae bacterium]